MTKEFSRPSTANPHLTHDEEGDAALRPSSFHDFTGQQKIVENLKIF
ncbi:MAG TPA: Holliday junction branch migration DNA helicase RuvB, partial [Candidatus Kapabacteria bacterium]|nr:Holliday junction branch migration DNA helicase RuvB [Candidatus Kapabacteria bacterium]